MRLILDRFEKTQDGKRIAVFEMNKELIEIHENDIPQNVLSELTEGIILECDVVDNRIIFAKILNEETQNKKQEMSNRVKNLFNRSKNQ